MNISTGRAVYKNAERSEASGWGVATLLREVIAKDVKARHGEGRDLTTRMLYLPALIVAGVLVACAAVLLVAKDFEACYEKIGYRTIRGPWKFEFKVPSRAGGDRAEREAED